MSEKIIEGNVLEEFNRDYTTFAIYSEMNRSVPKDRDGLIPVHRRVVFTAMYHCHAWQRIKCANIIGSTMANCHPHGDTSIESALYTLINWYSTKYPLFDGRGNFGNTFSSKGASPRYTEAKISEFCKECVLDELMQFEEVVDWIPNYDNRSKEPLYLPVKVPLLLLNGSMHISVGDKVDIPSHNIGEVIDATIHLIQNPNSEVSLVPDHCQACEIFDTDWDDISKKGFGYYKIRGIIEVADYFGKTKKYHGRKVLVIRSCPNLTYLGKIIDKIEELVKTNKIMGIEDTEDESKVNDMRYILILRQGVDPEFVRQALYQNTRLQQTCRVNLKVFTDDGQNVMTQRVSYTEYLKQFILHRKIIKLRLYELLLQKTRTRLHEIENYIWAIESKKIDTEVLTLIRNQKTVDDNAMCELLIKKLDITDLQAKFIMNLDVKKLSIGYYKQYCAERDKLKPFEAECIANIKDEHRLEQIIIDELLMIKAKYNTPRKCRILSAAESSGVPQGTFKITISEGNFIKKFGVEDNITGTRQGDSIKFVSIGDNAESLLIFDVNGKVYNLPISKIPFSDKSSPGVDIRIINKNINAPIGCVIYAPALEKFKNGCIVTVTRQGFIKRMTVQDFLSVPPSGLVYGKLDQGDTIVDVMLFNSNADVVVYNSTKALRININDIPILKRNSRGNVSMGGVDHEVLGMNVLRHDSTEIIGITSKGYINKIIPEVVPNGRAKAGKNVIKITKGDYLVSVLGVNEMSIIRCTTDDGQFIDIVTNQIPLSSSISTGVKYTKGNRILKAWNVTQQ